MNILKIQEQIDSTNYRDAYALDFRASFFGDDVNSISKLKMENRISIAGR